MSLSALTRVRSYAVNRYTTDDFTYQKRFMAKVLKNPQKKGFRINNSSKEPQMEGQKENALGAYKPLPSAVWSHDLCKPRLGKLFPLPPFRPNRENVGKAVEFRLPEHAPIRIFGLPKNLLLEFRLLSKPCSIVRDITVCVTERLQEATNNSSIKNRLIINGPRGCGKSFVLLQAVEHCIANNWIVLYIPRAVNLVNSSTPYKYDIRTRTFLQPKFSHQLLQRFRTVNFSALGSLTTTRKLVLERREIPHGTSLADLIGVAIKEPPLSSSILEALLVEISNQTKHPVLFAVDDFQAIYCQTAHRDPHYEPILPFHLAIPRFIMEYASGKRLFARGAFVGAISNSDTTYKPPLELQEGLNLSSEKPVSPYDKRSPLLMQYISGLESLTVPDQLTTKEAASLYELWMKNGSLVPSIHDETFLAKYMESSGNAREFVWKGLLSSIEL